MTGFPHFKPRTSSVPFGEGHRSSYNSAHLHRCMHAVLVCAGRDLGVRVPSRNMLLRALSESRSVSLQGDQGLVHTFVTVPSTFRCRRQWTL